MDSYTELFTNQISSGASVNEALALLKTHGALPVQAIKAIRLALGISLGEAKQLFAECPTWEAEVQAGNALHEDVITTISMESKP